MPDSINVENVRDLLLDFAKLGTLSHATIIECEDVKETHDFLMDVIKTKLCVGKARPCNRCGNCIKVERGLHPDVTVIEAEGKNKSIKIEDIRKIREDAYILSNEGAGKFYLIEDADFMTIQAQNALIKILEEPPQGVAFILICSSSNNLLQTVRSRAHIFKIKSNLGDTSKDLLPEKIVRSSLNGRSDEVLEYFSSIENNRQTVKELTEGIIECFLECLAKKGLDKNLVDSIIPKIDKLRYLVSLIDKNVNMNLLICRICACL